MFPDETTSSNRQRTPHSTRRRLKSPHHLSASPSRPRRLRPTPKPIEVFHKCYSAPMIFPDDSGGVGDSCRSLDSDEGGWFGRLHTLDDIILCTGTSQTVASPNPHIIAEYQKDAKVLITVTVEGSPGPIKTLVRLGANVEDTIKLVIQKYGEEGRSPSLDKNATSSFDLYVSYFSLQSLNKSYAIGDVGSRSFYLRKSSKKSDGYEAVEGSQFSSKQSRSPVAILHPFITRKVNKFVRRLHRLFILLGCLHSR
ncbi:uncharacterized protein At4g22758 [Silene latifolia]|uniref:uncharacterized protein At4g22758 n=1 Tax=Silene latifolia TaxID=37657 RepID=UPI003D782062